MSAGSDASPTSIDSASSTGEWYVGVPSGRTRNASGGLVEYGGTLVFAHRVKGCDGQQVVESFNTDFRKKSTTAPLEIVNVGQVEQYFDPSIWDVAEVDAIETQHARIVFRLQDADRAKASAKRIEAGAERAFGIMPRPKGVDKVFYGLTWPKVDGELWGGVGLGRGRTPTPTPTTSSTRPSSPPGRRSARPPRVCRGPPAGSGCTRARSAAVISRRRPVTRRSTSSRTSGARTATPRPGSSRASRSGARAGQAAAG